MLKQKNIVLIGYRGVGKTTIAQKLSELLDYKVIATDALIEQKIGSISEYVAKNGWEAFRTIETEVIKSIGQSNMIIDCGGGAVLNEDNVHTLKKNAIFFWLSAPAAIIRQRLAQSHERPPLTQNASALDEIKGVLAQRIPHYKKAAQYEIPTKKISPDAITAQIAAHYFKETLPARTVISLAPKTTAAACRQLQKIPSEFTLLEIRIDVLQDINPANLKKIIAAKNKTQHLIITNRVAREGGSFQGSETQRISMLKMAAEYGADFIDIEYSCGHDAIDEFVPHKKKSRIICSYHNFKEMPENIGELYQGLKATDADVLKIACLGNSFDDNLRMLSLIGRAKKEKVKLIGMIMGPYGALSRLAADHAGSPITTYAPLHKAQATAPGQLAYPEFKKKYEILWKS